MGANERAARVVRRGATRVGGIMAKESASATSAGLLAIGSRSASPKQLWQVPTFLAGLLALAAVWAVRPLWHQFGAHGLDHDLVLLRRALAEPQVDLQEVLARAEKALGRSEQSPRRAGEIHYLIGAIYVRLTRQVDQERAADAWQKARYHLEQAEEQGTPEADQPRLALLLGKTWHHLGVDPRRVITCLTSSLPSAVDEQGEGYGLLAEAYLRLPTPEVRAALAANEKQLACPTLDDSALAQPRLLRAELLFRLEEPEEARKVLKHLLARRGPGTPPRILERARFMLARSLQDEGAWSESLALWGEVQTDPESSFSEKARSLYFLGLCHRKLGHLDEASRAWERARKGSGEEGRAATLALAELWIDQKTPVPALQAFAAFVQGVKAPEEYQNSLVDLATARASFEHSCQLLLDAGDYASAVQVARLYEKLALPGKSDELLAQTAEAWGRQLLDQSRRAANSGEVKRLDEAARDQFRQAGRAYETGAEAARTPEERNEWLWRAADRFLQGREPEQALRVLEQFVKLTDVSSARLGEAWYVMAEAHRTLQHEVAAQVAYRRCIEYTGPYAYQARYQLAQAEVERKDLDEAEAHLKQNLELIQASNDGVIESEAYEKSLFRLADLTFQRGEYRQAERYLTKAVERFPANPEARRARFQLARCYRMLADQEGQLFSISDQTTGTAQSHYRREKLRLLELASVHYLKIIDDLTPQPPGSRLSEEDEFLLKQASFGIADCRYAQGQYDESIRLYEKLAAGYPKQVDGLIALWYIRRCYWVKSQPDKVRLTYERIRLALTQMDPSAFDDASETRTRRWWEKWLAENR